MLSQTLRPSGSSRTANTDVLIAGRTFLQTAHLEPLKQHLTHSHSTLSMCRSIGTWKTIFIPYTNKNTHTLHYKTKLNPGINRKRKLNKTVLKEEVEDRKLRSPGEAFGSCSGTIPDILPLS